MDNENNIITGHGRYKALLKLANVTGDSVIQVIELPMTKEQSKAYLLADNRIGEDSEWDKEKLFETFKDLEIEGFDVLDTGFTNFELNVMGYEMELINSVDELDDVLDPTATKPTRTPSPVSNPNTGPVKPNLNDLPPEMVVLSFTITGEDRDKAITVLNRVMNDNALKNISESFMRLIEENER